MTARSGASALLAALGAAAGLLAPPAAQAADRLVLTPHVDVAHLYTDNVFTDSESEKNDSITQIRPSLALEGRSETGSLALVVGAKVSKYWRYSELDSIDPFVRTEFTRDLTEMARLGKVQKAVGRESEIMELVEISARKGKSNVIIVGEAGTGKTKIVEDLACRMVEGEFKGIIEQNRILELNISALIKQYYRPSPYCD